MIIVIVVQGSLGTFKFMYIGNLYNRSGKGLNYTVNNM